MADIATNPDTGIICVTTDGKIKKGSCCGDAAATYWQLRRCGDDVLVDLWVPASGLPGFAVRADGTCYYADGDTENAEHGTLLVNYEFVASCADALCVPSGCCAAVGKFYPPSRWIATVSGVSIMTECPDFACPVASWIIGSGPTFSGSWLLKLHNPDMQDATLDCGALPIGECEWGATGTTSTFSQYFSGEGNVGCDALIGSGSNLQMYWDGIHFEIFVQGLDVSTDLWCATIFSATTAAFENKACSEASVILANTHTENDPERCTLWEVASGGSVTLTPLWG